jgi:hypothetical protein
MSKNQSLIQSSAVDGRYHSKSPRLRVMINEEVEPKQASRKVGSWDVGANRDLETRNVHLCSDLAGSLPIAGQLAWTRSRRSVLVAATWWSSSTARVGRFSSKWRCQCGCRMLADFPGVVSHMAVSGQLHQTSSAVSERSQRRERFVPGSLRTMCDR